MGTSHTPALSFSSLTNPVYFPLAQSMGIGFRSMESEVLLLRLIALSAALVRRRFWRRPLPVGCVVVLLALAASLVAVACTGCSLLTLLVAFKSW